MPRAKPTRSTKKMRRDALEAAHRIATSTKSPDYAVIRAAALLLGKVADEDESERDPDAPVVRQITPWNCRPMWKDSKPILPRFGLTGEPDQQIVVIPKYGPFPHGANAKIQPESFYQPFVDAWQAQYEIRVVEKTAARLAIHERHIENGVAPDVVANLLQHNPHDAIFQVVIAEPRLLPAPDAPR
jgi:hypothetical protein